MGPQEAIVAFANRQIDNYTLYRALLAHGDWRVPMPATATKPTIMVSDAAMTPSIWAFSSESAYQASCAQVNAAAIGPVVQLAHLDAALLEDDPSVARLTIDPAGPLTFHIQTDELAIFRRLSHGVGIERAMSERSYAALRAFGRYAVPYFGVLGRGHNLVTLPSERGKMLAAFTAADAIDAFLAAGSAANRAAVQFAIVSGEQLFGIVEQVAEGVLVNAMGPRTFGFQLEVCRAIMNAR